MPRPAAYSELGSPRPIPQPHRVFIIPLSANSRIIYTKPDGTFISASVKREARINPDSLIKSKAPALLRASRLTSTKQFVTLVNTIDGTAYYIFAWLVEDCVPVNLVGHDTVRFLPTLSDALQTRLGTQLPTGLIPLPDNLDRRPNKGFPK